MPEIETASNPQTTDRDVPEPLQQPNEVPEAWLMRRIWDRINRDNEHFMACLVGREGSGKSWTAIRLAEAIDPTFNADRVIFDVAELLEILADGDHDPGNAYVLDEAGVSFGRRTWQDRAQILANQAMQLIRSHNLALYFTLPRLGELDSQTQGRLQAFYEITDKNRGNWVEGKWKWIDPDRTDQTGKNLQKYPRQIIDGQVVRHTRMRFGPPSQEVVDNYEARKKEFQRQMYQETIAELRGGEDEDLDDAEEQMSVNEVVEDITSENLDKYIGVHGGNGRRFIDQDLIRLDYNLSVRDAKTVKKVIDRDADIDISESTRTA